MVAVRVVPIPKIVPKEMQYNIVTALRKVMALYGAKTDRELSFLFSRNKTLVTVFRLRRTRCKELRFHVYYNSMEMLRRLMVDKDANWRIPKCTEGQLNIANHKYDVLIRGGMDKHSVLANTQLQPCILRRIITRDPTISYGVLQDAIRRMDYVLRYFGYNESAAVGSDAVYVPDTTLPAVNRNFVEYRYTKMKESQIKMTEANAKRIIDETIDEDAFDDELL